MKRFFIKFWWAFPILLTVSPLMLMLSTSFFYHLDWCAKVPMLILYVFVFLLTLILLIVSWVVLLPLMKGIDECSYEEFQYALSVGVTARALHKVCNALAQIQLKSCRRRT